MQAEKLSLIRVWKLLGPMSASSTSVSLFARSYGFPLLSIFISAMWAVIISPAAQALAESQVVFRGEPRPMPKRLGCVYIEGGTCALWLLSLSLTRTSLAQARRPH